MKKKKVNERIELAIESVAFEGKSVARHDNLVYFVKNAVPGDVVIAEVTKKKKSWREAFMVEIVTPSEDRVQPDCPYSDYCGGCSMQNLDYQRQLYWKKRHIADAFERVGKVPVGRIGDVHSSQTTFRYRNKMEFSFGASRWWTSEEIVDGEDIANKRFALGLHIPERFDKVLDIDSCLIQSEAADNVLKAVRAAVPDFGCTAYNTRTYRGFLRNLVIRYTGLKELMVILVTSAPETEEDRALLNWYENELDTAALGINSLVHAVCDKKSDLAIGEIDFIKGADFIYDSILGIKYKISPFSFFQTNSGQLSSFIAKIVELASIGKDDVVWDLYCGTGSITLPAAKHAGKILGFEIVASSVSDAKENARINNIDNAEFVCIDLHDRKIGEMMDAYPRPDIVIIDPPRAGMHPAMIDLLNSLKSPRIVYVSCNPMTQARDCSLLAENYEVLEIDPFDMFPHTYHIESIALLRLKT